MSQNYNFSNNRSQSFNWLDNVIKKEKPERTNWIQPDIDYVLPERLEELNKILKRGGYSEVGFIADDDDVIDIIRNDKKYLKSVCITNKQIASKMKELADKINWDSYEEYEDNNFIITGKGWMGYQFSPFEVLYDEPDINRDYFGNAEITITNKKLNETIMFPSLAIHLIDKYSFFQGPGMYYRTEPADLIRILEIKKDKNTNCQSSYENNTIDYVYIDSSFKKLQKLASNLRNYCDELDECIEEYNQNIMKNKTRNTFSDMRKTQYQNRSSTNSKYIPMYKEEARSRTSYPLSFKDFTPKDNQLSMLKYGCDLS